MAGDAHPPSRSTRPAATFLRSLRRPALTERHSAQKSSQHPAAGAAVGQERERHYLAWHRKGRAVGSCHRWRCRGGVDGGPA